MFWWWAVPVQEKSRAYAVVNIMQCNCSMVVTDPKGELLRKTGGLLEREGYEVRVFDLINPETSFAIIPLPYVGMIKMC